MIQKSNDIVQFVPHFHKIFFVSFCGIAAFAGCLIILILTFLPTLLRIEFEARSISHGLRVITPFHIHLNSILMIQQRIFDATRSYSAIDLLLYEVISFGEVDITIKLLPFELDGRESVRTLGLVLEGKLLGGLVQPLKQIFQIFRLLHRFIIKSLKQKVSAMKYYLIGKNIETSLSPKIHNFLFRLKGRKPTYQEPISGKVFTLREMQDDTFGGMSITIPYKSLFGSEQAIIKQGQVSTKHGLLNTVYKDLQRKLCGTNTDIFGIQQCYQGNIELQHKNALIIGAGATAQIFCAFFEQHGFKTSFVNRSQGKEELRSRFGNIVDFLPLKPRPIDYKTALRYSTIVNTLPSEVVYDNWDDIQLNLKNLMKVYPRQNKTKLVYFNVNYRHKLDPIQELLRNKLSLHVATLKGIEMLLWQAIEQNKHFCLDNLLHQQQYTWQYNKLRQELNLN